MSTLLARPPEEAVRLVALGLLARVEDAVARLDAADDPEALHRFRVSVRRLRSVLRAYRRPLEGSVRKRDRRRLRDLAAVTGTGRDAEVAAAWLEAQRESLSPGQRRGLDWLLQRVEARRGKGYRKARETVAADFLPLADELRERLGVYTREVSLEGRGQADIFGELVGEEVVREVERLEALLARVEDPDAAEPIHDARLSAKRLRYLLEPLAPELGAVEPLIARLKGLQDLLGELNDAYVLERELEDAVDTAARDRARTLLRRALGNGGSGGEAAREASGDASGEARWEVSGEPSGEPGGQEGGKAAGEAGEDWEPVDGLLALARRNRHRRDRLFVELQEQWVERDSSRGPEPGPGPEPDREQVPESAPEPGPAASLAPRITPEAGAGERSPDAPAAPSAPRLRALGAAVRDLAHWLEAGFSPPPPASAGPAP